MAFLGPSHHAHAGGFAHRGPLQQPNSPWGSSSSFDSSGIDVQLSYEDSSLRQQPHMSRMDGMCGPFHKAAGLPECSTQHSRLGNLQHYSAFHSRGFHHAAAAAAHAGNGFVAGKLSPLGHAGLVQQQQHGPPLYPQDSLFGGSSGSCSSDFRSSGSGQQQLWEEPLRTHSPFRGALITSIRAQELRETGSGNSSPLGGGGGSSSCFSSSSPRGIDFRAKRHSGSTTGVSSPRTPPHGPGGHRVGIDPRLVVGSPLEVAWEVLAHNPQLASLLSLQPNTAKLRNLPVQQDEEGSQEQELEQQEQGSGELGDVLLDAAAAAAAGDAAAAGGAGGTAGCREADLPLVPEQLLREQGLVRSCRGLPARVRDDLIKAARLAVTRRDSTGREQRGTGLLPFFWRVQSNLKWLLQQPATLKGQLLPGQIDFITEEQRGLSFQKTVQQRMRLGELAVMLHSMLSAQEEPAAADVSSQGDSSTLKA